MSHTPGPWAGGLQISSSNESKIIAHIQTKEKKLQGYSNTNSVNPCEALANARLIAAAPELLQCAKCALADLEGILSEFETGGDRLHPGWQTLKELKAVIHKATGEQA
jgi:hypothetical protein